MTLEERVERLEADNRALRHLVLRLWIAGDLAYADGPHGGLGYRNRDEAATTQLRRRDVGDGS
jgi:hypothetical protein